ncbi:MAG: molybdopterin-dependent oxidoreductase [Deltaproteobacteria bacterium]|nr:MAG: molybdopterin-dependent oxidoreductase [Deltaproteobacteria bacterium]
MKDRLSVAGKSLPRIDALDKVTGRAKYGIDLRVDDMLHAKLLRSPYPHARVKAIDTTRAENHPRVRAISTIEEVPRVVGYWWNLRTEKAMKRMYLQDNVVRFRGDPVLGVAAEDEESAQEALSLIDVEYEQLPALFDPIEAIKEDHVKIHEGGNIAIHVAKKFGNVDQGFKQADYVFENRFVTSKQKHATIEPIGTAIADYDRSGRLTVYTSTQLPHWSRIYLAGALGLPVNRVRVIKPYTGGAFGGRCGLIHGLEVMCCFLSRKAGRPVKMSFSREEDFEATEARHPFIIELKTGVTKDGILTANSIKLFLDVGGYGTHYIGVLADALSTGVGLYRCPNVTFEGYCVYTNKSLNGAFRGYGNPQMNFAQESQMDMIAEKLAMDPVGFRVKNYRGLGEIDPVFDVPIRSDGMKECLTKGAKRFGWSKKRARKMAEGTKRRGVGMSCLQHGTGARFGLPDPASAIVMLNADGSANLVTAAADDGQGNRTVLAQIAAEELGMPLEQISVSDTDTDVAPLDGGTHGSRQTYCGGLAVKRAAADAKMALLQFASQHLNVDEKNLEIKDGVVYDVKDRSTNIRVGDLMRKVQIEDLSRCEQIIGNASGVAPAMPPTFGAHFAEVEVDMETGEVYVVRLVGAFDVGRAINPAHVEGQIIGGETMGIGYALTEGLIIEDGKIVNNNFTDYRMLRACDVPQIDAIIVESNEPTGPFGAKGIGESTMVGTAAAIANAIYDAIGVRMKELCITQEKILEAIHRGAKASGL